MNFIELRPGKSAENRPIPAFVSETTGSKYFYLLAGVHGDEVEGVYCLAQLFEWLKKSSEVEMPLVVIPVLNVDGLNHNTRINANGVDLNRNLPAKNWSPLAREKKYNPGKKPLSEPENILLTNLFAKYPPQFILSVHSWKAMINYNGDCKQEATIMHEENGYPMVDDIEDHPTPGSLGEYAPEAFGAPVLTFECPVIDDKVTLKDIWKENETAFKSLLRHLQVSKTN
jgi:protein MpaA